VARFTRTIPPGGEGKIVLKLKTKGYRDTIRKSAIVYSNDPEQPQITLTVEARFRTPISVEPKAILLHGFKEDDITEVVTIRAKENKPLKLEPLRLSISDKVAYELKTIEEGRVYQVILRNIIKKSGIYNGTLVLKTNYPERPEIPIIFIGYIKGDLQILPESIKFGHIKTPRKKSQKNMKPPYQRSVTVTLNRGNNLKIEKVEINEELFEVKVKEVKAGKSYRIDVRLHPEKIPKGDVNEKMKIYTNLKDEPLKVIPIRIQIK
jgi:biopolymer transport protein ExbD